DGHAAEVRSAPAPYGESSTLHFPIANHKHKWDLRLFRFSNFEPNFFIPKISLGTEPCSLELCHDLGSIGPLVVRDGHDHRLNRGEPGWEGTAKMLNQNTKKSFDRSHQGPMDHDRLMNLAVFPNVAKFEPFGIIEIDLNS